MSKHSQGDPWYVLRGGSWYNDGPQDLRAAFRIDYNPDYRFGSFVFRVAAAAVPQDSR